MFRLFRKRKTVKTDVAPGKLLQWLTVRAIRFQKRWADLMQKGMEKLSLRGKRIVVISFCILSLSYCCLIIYRSFHNGKTKPFSITPIQAPAHVTETGEVSIARDVIIPETEYRQITWFHKYIDSLSASGAGKQIADSILAPRPHLMDSIRQLEAIYHLQQQLKK